MSPQREFLLERVVGAWRARDPDGRVCFEPAFWDLDDEGRRAAYQETLRARSLEAALDPGGLSSTARAVLARIRSAEGGARD